MKQQYNHCQENIVRVKSPYLSMLPNTRMERFNSVLPHQVIYIISQVLFIKQGTIKYLKSRKTAGCSSSLDISAFLTWANSFLQASLLSFRCSLFENYGLLSALEQNVFFFSFFGLKSHFHWLCLYNAVSAFLTRYLHVSNRDFCIEGKQTNRRTLSCLSNYFRYLCQTKKLHSSTTVQTSQPTTSSR